MRRPQPGFARALRGTAGPHAEALRHRLIADHRDPRRSVRAAALYEELRQLDDRALAARAPGPTSGYGRSTLIAVVVLHELKEES